MIDLSLIDWWGVTKNVWTLLVAGGLAWLVMWLDSEYQKQVDQRKPDHKYRHKSKSLRYTKSHHEKERDHKDMVLRPADPVDPDERVPNERS